MLLHSNNKEKIENMMKILHQFIKFCKEKSINTSLDLLIRNNFGNFYEKQKNRLPFLNSFIKEFFQDSYQKEKSEY